ncbi:CHAT domain-containing protein [Streptomyces sp. WI04-05B]|uniref:CHAT domain-containing protein n=1 Tax=Streptomyces TaxID=1883 RepID=UPI0029AF3763|nr:MULTISPECIES: CHAT domain-containing protein [unclassified Streptomyces]MDX2545210.1 CHAT domain-containing protein [Streptomyces sp. WI04-05B]MDX2587324.1 CHAT domain-containing protein [Streptomyces sp. WI04-05A]
MVELSLLVEDFAGPDRWRWVLVAPDGEVLARHEVRLDRSGPQYEAFVDLPGYLRRHAAPDVRAVREREIVRDVGTWIGAEVLGPVAPVLLAAAPAVVRVVVPRDVPAARRLMFVPLELAHARGRPLAVQDVTLVTQWGTEGRSGGRGSDRPDQLDRPVRVLALFSLPEGSRALNLRRERLALTRLFTDAARSGRAVEVRTLQYGVTRERLRAVLAGPDGWDLVHVSGHGAPGELLLETDAGRPDRIRAPELVDLLGATRGVSLVTLSACWSAAAGDPVGDEDSGDPEEPAARAVVGAVAGDLVERLGCAVLAMRYPVEDGFAIALAERLYRQLVVEGQVLPRALARVLGELSATDTGAEGVPGSALRAATPALFGARAVGLTLDAPRGAPPGEATGGDTGRETGGADIPGRGTAAELPPEPDHFVGRVALLSRAGAALAPRSGLRGVLLQGMPGAGKTACARELAATHAHAFEQVVWFTAPQEQDDAQHPEEALASFALALERAVPELRCLSLLDADGPDRSAREFVGAVSSWLERERVLLVVDGIDALLTPDRAWRDPRWGALVGALSGHTGAGRLILCGRVRPAGLGTRVRTEPVDLLTRDEALLLARELPHLARLIAGQLPSTAPEVARRLATGLLELAQGHPGLLELADTQAADPERLTRLLAAGNRAAARATTGDGGADEDGDERLRVLRAWSVSIAAELAPTERDLFHVLCCLEETDRSRAVLDHNWRDLCDRLGHPDTPVDAALRTLVAHGLLTPRPGQSYEIQAAVAAEGRARAGARVREPVDTRMWGYWLRVFEMAWTREGTDAEGARLAGPLLTHAALSAAPYLIRLGQESDAATLLEAVLRRDTSGPTRARVLPLLRRIAMRAASAPGTGVVPPTEALARVLIETDPALAERRDRAALASALERGDHSAAATATSGLVDLCLRAGRLTEALTLAEQGIEHVRRAGSGTWTTLLYEVQRLHVLSQTDRAGEALAEADALHRRARDVPRERGPREGVDWWEVWEELCDTGQRAAIEAGEWHRALEYADDLCASKQARGAPVTDFARARLPAYMPLLSLGRTREALRLLEECREVFEAAGDFPYLGEVFGALGNVAHVRGHGEVAIARERDSLRYAYRAGLPALVAVGHANLGTYLHVHARDAAGAVAHHLAGALLGTLAGGGRTTSAALSLADDLREFGPDAQAQLPVDVEELCARVAEVPGVALDRLLAGLDPGLARARETLATLVRDVRRSAAEEARGTGTGPVTEAEWRRLATVQAAAWGMTWEPALAALLAAERRNTAAKVKLRQHLAQLSLLDPMFVPLADVLTRIQSGERGPGVLAGLKPLDATVARRALDALAGRVAVPVEMWTAMHLGIALGIFVTTALGGDGTDEATRENLDGFASDPRLAPMASALERILGGERDPALGAGLPQPTQRAAVAAVLHHLNVAETAVR